MEKTNICQSPLEFLAKDSDVAIILIVMNQAESFSGKLPESAKARLQLLWDKAIYKVSIDGGTNFLHSLNEEITTFEEKFVPDLISGDFDSIYPELLNIYKEFGSEIIATPDQNHTDFTKCLHILKQKFENGLIPQVSNIIVVTPEFSERLDHIWANINTIYQASSLLPEIKNFGLLSEKTYTFIVSSGRSNIQLNDAVSTEIALLAVGHPSTVTTSGFTKNLNNYELTFGHAMQKFVLNPHSSKSVCITTTKPLLMFLSVNL